MAEVVVVAAVRIKEGGEEVGRNALRAMVDATHAEPGCITHALHQGRDDPSLFVFVERWASQEALDAHFASEHMTTFRAVAVDVIDETVGVWGLDAVPLGDAAKGIL
jgi:quinol monooxygenase YgiN